MQKSIQRSLYVTLLLVTASFAKVHPHPRPSTVANKPCGENCPLTKEPVCGSDGKTYTNECTMKYENCLAGNHGVRKTHDGACGKNCGGPCSYNPSKVCGSDGKTYLNECIMKFETCEKGNQGVRKAHDGACATGKNCGGPCSYNPIEVCGSDGKTYLNECVMKYETCMAGNLGVYKVLNRKCDYK